MDIAVELATPVYAAGSGSVIYAGRKGGYGRCIIIQHKFGFTTVYGHLSAYYTTVGREIKQGQAILSEVQDKAQVITYTLRYEKIKEQ